MVLAKLSDLLLLLGFLESDLGQLSIKLSLLLLELLSLFQVLRFLPKFDLTFEDAQLIGVLLLVFHLLCNFVIQPVEHLIEALVAHGLLQSDFTVLRGFFYQVA